MKNAVILSLLLLITLLFTACMDDDSQAMNDEGSNQDNENPEKTEKTKTEIPETDNWKLSSKFDYTVEPKNSDQHTYKIVGKKDTFGFTGPFPIVSKQPKKYMWFYFGKEDVYDIPVELKAVKKGTDKIINLDSGTFFKSAAVSPDSVNMPSILRFPSAGVWKILVYTNEKHVESIVVNVE